MLGSSYNLNQVTYVTSRSVETTYLCSLSYIRRKKMATAQIARDSTASKTAAHTPVRSKGRPPKGDNSSKAEYRLQVKLTPSGKERLDTIVARVDGESAAHVVRDALRIYDILTEEVMENGSQLFIKDGETGEAMKLRLW